MTKQIEALKLALEMPFVTIEQKTAFRDAVRDILNEAIAESEQQSQEPVAETAGNSVKWLHKRLSNFPCGIKLYTAPPDQAREIEELKEIIKSLEREHKADLQFILEQKAHINVLQTEN